MKLEEGLIIEESIEDPSRDSRAYPYLILALTKDDTGKKSGRTQEAEYKTRTPYCVKWETDSIALTISNLGKVASDLVRVDYQLVFCMDQNHKRDEGFSQSHAGEIGGDTRDEYQHIDLVQPMSNITMRIKLPPLPPYLANLYFRAKVATLWSKPSIPTSWEFATDVTVIEATKRFV